MNRRSARLCRGNCPASPPGRRGSTLMIVIVLMGLLAVLGVLFYTFAAQERSNSEYYSDGAKNVADPGLSADVLMDFALQQLVVGTDPRLKNSALWGSRHSLLANALGVKNHALGDLAAFDGQGVVVGVDVNGKPIVDYARTGSESTASLTDALGPVFTSSSGSNLQDLLGMNDSPAANLLFERDTGRFPQPDVGYTYPDINNAFLAYNGWVRDRNAPYTVRRVIIPSFHRPQLYRDASGAPIPLFEDRNYNGTLDSGESRNSGTALDYGQPMMMTGSDPNRANRLFRPHPDHLFVPPNGRPPAPTRRFIHLASEAQSLLGDGKRVFPFMPMYPGYNPSSNGSTVTFTGIPNDWYGHQGVWSGPHPNDPSYSSPNASSTQFTNVTLHDQTQYDVDNDGDGIREGVWLDLDFPVQELPDGTQFVPLFSFTVYDLDSLLNLNVHGNIQNLLFNYPSGMAFDNLSNPFGWNLNTNRMDFIAASNLGMMPSEVNPAWALTGRAGIECSTSQIGSVFAQYQLFFGNAPPDVSTFAATAQQQLGSYQQTANMELANLLMGRPELNAGSGSVDKLHPGLYGEESLIANNLGAPGTRDPRQYPHPGQSLKDDNNDLNEHMTSAPQSTGGSNPLWLDVEQPYDALGIGSILQPAAGGAYNPKALNRYPASGRVRWQRFVGYASNGNVFWGNSGIQSGNLMVNSQAYGLFDDPSEVALWPTDRRDVDDPFSAADAAWLAMSNNDLTTLGISSRLSSLASFNFSTSTTTNQRGEEIRKRFTTVANDRKNFAAPRARGTDGRNWEWTDDNGNTTSVGGSKLRFPPTFGAAGSAIRRYSVRGRNGASVDDPFRPAVRYLLQATRDDLQVKQFQQRLAVNQFLYFDSQSNQLVYRDLTPHPLDPGASPIPSATSLGINYTDAVRPALAQLSPAQQEFWARRDRQQLARDIYVLLYLLGAPGTSTNPHYTSSDNPTRTGWSNPYTTEQLEQMAQFAVNLVDAQDRDNVFTRFEYDTNLSDGWNLDDDPYTVDSGAPDRAEVWGLERPQLALSELIAVNAPSSPMPRSYTAWDDMNERHFLCVELRNVAPYDVKFNDAHQEWQLMVRQEPAGTPDPTRWRLLTFRGPAGRVNAGGFYTVFSTDRNEPSTNPSIMRVDPAGGSAVAPIIPSDSSGTFAGNASANGSFIDLVKEVSNNAFKLTDGQATPQDLSGTPGALLNDGGTGLIFNPASSAPVEVILRRRAHPTRALASTSAEDADNPWVEVDRISAEFRPFSPASSSATDVQAALDSLRSRERREILSRESEGDNTTPPGSSHVVNTLGAGSAAENSLTPSGGVFTVMPVHFDRQFVSLAEALHVPLFGPHASPTDGSYGRKDSPTLYYGAAGKPPGTNGQHGAPQLLPPGVGATDAPLRNYAKTALGAFLTPDHPTQGTLGTVDSDWDNRWYRLLEFLEVPTRQHKNLAMGSTFNIPRVAGKINLNTARYPEVLAALLDDEDTLQINLNYDSTQTSGSVRDSNYPQLRTNSTLIANDLDASGQPRDWFEQLQNSRDPQDPRWLGLGRDLRLPGLALNTSGTAAKGVPFRSFAYVDDIGSSDPAQIIEHTLLRQLPVDSMQSDTRRRLFEVGSYSEHQNASLDPQLRHRLLSKIWNNTTVRSNTFVAFISVKLFRAAFDPTTGATRIGGPVREFNTPYRGQNDNSPELPEFRGVFIIDRSQVEQGLAAGGGSGITSFAPFVTYRKILEE